MGSWLAYTVAPKELRRFITISTPQKMSDEELDELGNKAASVPFVLYNGE